MPRMSGGSAATTPAPVRARFLLLTVVLELGARLTLLGSALALFSSAVELRHAAGLAGVASLLGLVRTAWRAAALRVHIEALYGALVRAVARKSTPSLVANREHGQAAGLVDALYEVAALRAITLPDAIGSIGAVLFLLAVVALRLGPLWLAIGGGLAAGLLLLFTPARRAARRARERGWKAHVTSAKLFEALVFGSAELRSSGLDAVAGRALDEQGRALARAERAGVRLGVVTAALPAALALGLVIVPRELVLDLFGERAGEVAVLAGTGVSFSLTVVASLEAIARSRPVRDTLAAFIGPDGAHLALAPLAPAAATPETVAAVRIQRIEARGLCVRHDGAERDTPSGLDLTLERPGGAAIVGPNGSGKTTALLALAGLVPARAGELRVNEQLPSPDAWEALRSRMLLIPQLPFVVADETLAWHIGLFGTLRVDEARVCEALRQLGLAGLEARAAARGLAVGDLPMGELSGGEQRRVALARALVHERDLILVDEPEAGLDPEGRAVVENLLGDLAKSHLVVVVAHDPSVVPASFVRVEAGSSPR